MKVGIGKYTSWFGPYQLCDILKYVGVSEETRDKWAEKIPEKSFSWFDKTFKKRKIKIRIDKYDTWGMDHTLALIIHPMLLQLKATKQGAPNVDDEDVPEHLRSTAAAPKENDWDTDEHHFARYDWVLDEMIFAFEKKNDDKWEDEFYSGESDLQFVPENPDETDKEKQMHRMIDGPNHTFKVDREGMDKVQKRMSNGFRLFGKYYESLWD